MDQGSNEIKIISISDSQQSEGIFKFENCKFRSRNQTIKNASCCSARKISGFYCAKINKFPVNFSTDCEKCTVFEHI